MKINSFRNWEARATLLLTDESGMSSKFIAANPVSRCRGVCIPAICLGVMHAPCLNISA